MKYFSLEQLICAGLAEYKENLSKRDIDNLLNAVKTFLPNYVVCYDIIRFTKDYIAYEHDVIGLREGITLEDFGEFEGKNITLKEYLTYIAGEGLIMVAKDMHNLEYGEAR